MTKEFGLNLSKTYHFRFFCHFFRVWMRDVIDDSLLECTVRSKILDKHPWNNVDQL